MRLTCFQSSMNCYYFCLLLIFLHMFPFRFPHLAFCSRYSLQFIPEHTIKLDWWVCFFNDNDACYRNKITWIKYGVSLTRLPTQTQALSTLELLLRMIHNRWNLPAFWTSHTPNLISKTSNISKKTKNTPNRMIQIWKCINKTFKNTLNIVRL